MRAVCAPSASAVRRGRPADGGSRAGSHAGSHVRGVHEQPVGCRYDGQVVLDDNGLWRSLVAHLTGGQGVAGSNPVSPTREAPVDRKIRRGFRFLI